MNAARDAALTFMVGAPDQAFGKVKELLDKMGKNVVHCGPVGTGQVHHIINCGSTCKVGHVSFVETVGQARCSTSSTVAVPVRLAMSLLWKQPSITISVLCYLLLALVLLMAYIYLVIFSAVKQIHCAYVTCDSD